MRQPESAVQPFMQETVAAALSRRSTQTLPVQGRVLLQATEQTPPGKLALARQTRPDAQAASLAQASPSAALGLDADDDEQAAAASAAQAPRR